MLCQLYAAINLHFDSALRTEMFQQLQRRINGTQIIIVNFSKHLLPEVEAHSPNFSC